MMVDWNSSATLIAQLRTEPMHQKSIVFRASGVIRACAGELIPSVLPWTEGAPQEALRVEYC
jgi:hypothetical protein